VPTGTAKLRLVIDYKNLNANTISDRYPMQNPSVILSGMAKYLSTTDFESAFHQILINETDIQKTSFSINNGKYEVLPMPFGLKNAPRIFQRAMDDILREQVKCAMLIKANPEKMSTIIKCPLPKKRA